MDLKELTDGLAQMGVKVGYSTIRNYVNAGLIDKPIRKSLGRHMGQTVEFSNPDNVLEEAYVAHVLRNGKRIKFSAERICAARKTVLERERDKPIAKGFPDDTLLVTLWMMHREIARKKRNPEYVLSEEFGEDVESIETAMKNLIDETLS